jgi:hypothetical protein
MMRDILFGGEVFRERVPIAFVIRPAPWKFQEEAQPGVGDVLATVEGM